MVGLMQVPGLEKKKKKKKKNKEEEEEEKEVCIVWQSVGFRNLIAFLASHLVASHLSFESSIYLHVGA